MAELEKEQRSASRRPPLPREAQVKAAEREMRVQVAGSGRPAIEGENLAQATVAASQAELAVKRAEAYQLGESRKREAEAAVLEAQNRAMAKAALAEAERVEAEKRAQLGSAGQSRESPDHCRGRSRSRTHTHRGRAQADAIFAKLEAEARGQYEILAKKGEGLKQIIDACGGSKEAFQMLMLEHLDNLAEASSRAISNIKFDKVVVWENGGQNGQGNTAGFLSNMANTLPPMLQVMKDIGGIELPESLVKLNTDTTAAPAATPKAEE